MVSLADISSKNILRVPYFPTKINQQRKTQREVRKSRAVPSLSWAKAVNITNL